jgi:hypothetical protein
MIYDKFSPKTKMNWSIIITKLLINNHQNVIDFHGHGSFLEHSSILLQQNRGIFEQWICSSREHSKHIHHNRAQSPKILSYSLIGIFGQTTAQDTDLYTLVYCTLFLKQLSIELFTKIGKWWTIFSFILKVSFIASFPFLNNNLSRFLNHTLYDIINVTFFYGLLDHNIYFFL